MDEILQADQARYRAMLQGNMPALADLLADDLSYTHSSVLNENKSQYLASVGSGRFQYLGVATDDVQVRVYGDAAVMHGKVKLDALVDGERRELHNRFLSVWSRPGGYWQMSAWASTPLPVVKE